MDITTWLTFTAATAQEDSSLHKRRSIGDLRIFPNVLEAQNIVLGEFGLFLLQGHSHVSFVSIFYATTLIKIKNTLGQDQEKCSFQLFTIFVSSWLMLLLRVFVWTVLLDTDDFGKK